MAVRNIFILVLIAIIIVLLLKYCGKDSGGTPSVKIDTVWVKVRQDTAYIPLISTMYLPGKAPKAFEKWDTLYVEGETVVDTLAILKDYHSFYLYNDTLKNKYGYVLVKDTISRNRILGRGVITDLSIPEITKTITLMQPKKRQVYVGAGIFGNKKDPLGGYQINLNLKTRKDQMIGIGIITEFNGQNYFGVNYARVISFKK